MPWNNCAALDFLRKNCIFSLLIVRVGNRVFVVDVGFATYSRHGTIDTLLEFHRTHEYAHDVFRAISEFIFVLGEYGAPKLKSVIRVPSGRFAALRTARAIFCKIDKLSSCKITLYI
jgi:hypothetical protein